MNVYQQLIGIAKELSLDDGAEIENQTTPSVQMNVASNSIGFDSLDQVEFVMALEERFGLAIDDVTFERYFEHETVSSFVSLIVTEILKEKIFSKPMSRHEIATAIGIPEDDVQLDDSKCTVTLGTTKDAINVTLSA